MKISVILAHPDPQSLNHALSRSVKSALDDAGHRVTFHDLYSEDFPALAGIADLRAPDELPTQIKQHCEELQSCEGIIIIHPNWWGQPPAILKGWVDRVCRPNIAYRFLAGDSGEGIPEGLLKNKKALILNTSDTQTDREKSAFGDPLQTLWESCIFDFCGLTDLTRKTFSVVATSTPTQRQIWIAEAASLATTIFP